MSSLIDKAAFVSNITKTVGNKKHMEGIMEVDMFEVTEKASDMIKDFLKDRDEIPHIRIMLSQGG